MSNVQVKYLAWEIQKACNLGCRFCYSSSWNLNREDKAEEGNPTVKEIKKGLRFLKDSELGVEYINWTGGEPLLRKNDLPNILSYSRNIGFKNVISTNSNFSGLGFDDADAYFRYLDKIADSLDVLSVSLDSSNQSANNTEMRVKYDSENKFASITVSNHYQDCVALIEEFKKRRFPFSLKINTLVTKKNKEHLGDFVDLLRDVPCIWHLIQFNPRQCPKDSITEFSLGDVKLSEDSPQEEIARRDLAATNEFKTIVMDIERQVELSEQPCKFFITTRLYDGSNNPYCFLVFNTNDKVLLPLGEEHKIVGTLPIRNGAHSGSTGQDAWLSGLTGKIIENCKAAESFKACNNDKAECIKHFNDSNAKVLARYLHPTAALHHSTESLQILRHCLVTTVQNEVLNENDVPKQFLAPDSQQTGDAAAFLLESPRVGRFLYENFGVVGGTLALLPTIGSNKSRIAPALQNPPGLHVPWCFPSVRDKNDYFRSLFKGTKEGNFSAPEFILDRLLPTDIIDELLGQPGREKLDDFFKNSTEPEEATDASIFLTLTRAAENVVGRLVAHFHTGDDPWAKAFVQQNERKAYLFNESTEASRDVKAWLDSLGIDDAIKMRWSSSGAEAGTPAKDAIPSALWYFLFDPLLQMGLPLPSVYAFRLAEASGYVAVGSIYLIKDYKTTIGPDEDSIGQRLGAFFETLAWPSIAQQFAAIEKNLVTAQEESRKNEAVAGLHRRIESDLTALINATHKITSLTLRIENSMNSSKDSYLRLYDHLGQLFNDQKTYYYPPDVSKDTEFKLQEKGEQDWTEINTIHSAGNPGKQYEDIREAWTAYANLLQVAASPDSLDFPFLIALADQPIGSDDDAVRCFTFLKQIIQRPHVEPSQLYDGQVAFSLCLASKTLAVKFEDASTEHDIRIYKKEDEKLVDMGPLLEPNLKRGEKYPLFADVADAFLLIASTSHSENPRCVDILSAMMRFCTELFPSGERSCKLESIRIHSMKEGIRVAWICKGAIRKEAYRLDETSKGRSLRSCLLTMCRAANMNQPEFVTSEPNSTRAGFFVQESTSGKSTPDTTFYFQILRSAGDSSSTLTARESSE